MCDVVIKTLYGGCHAKCIYRLLDGEEEKADEEVEEVKEIYQ